MRKVTMIRSGNAEHPNCIEGEADPESGPTKADPKNAETSQVDRPEGALLHEVHRMKGLSFDSHRGVSSPTGAQVLLGAGSHGGSRPLILEEADCYGNP